MPIAYIALGSNLEPRKENLCTAINEMQKQGLQILGQSSFYETEPYGVVDQPAFINGVVKVATNLNSLDLLKTLLAIEQKMGRIRKRHWGERNIDLDIIFYEQEIVKQSELILPHPDMQNRRFVLEPLAEIAANVLHPIFKLTVSEMLKKLIDGDEKI